MNRILGKNVSRYRRAALVYQKRAKSESATPRRDGIWTPDGSGNSHSVRRAPLSRTRSAFRGPNLRQAIFKPDNAPFEPPPINKNKKHPSQIDWRRIFGNSDLTPNARVQHLAQLAEILLAQQARSRNAVPLASLFDVRLLDNQDQSADKQSLRKYNAFLQRQLALGYTISYEDAGTGILLALSAGSGWGLGHYLDLVDSHNLDLGDRWVNWIAVRSRKIVQQANFEDCIKDSSFAEVFGRLLKWIGPQLYSPRHPRSFTIVGVWKEDEYFALVGRFCGPEGILRVWEDMTAEIWMPSRIYSEPLRYRFYQTMNPVLRQLIAYKAPDLAWKILTSVEWQTKDIESETWTALHTYPEAINVRQLGMEEVV